MVLHQFHHHLKLLKLINNCIIVIHKVEFELSHELAVSIIQTGSRNVQHFRGHSKQIQDS